MAIQVTADERRIIIGILSEILPSATYVMFGSRVTGRAKRYSDLDLAVDATNKMSLIVLSEMTEAFAQSSLTYKVDIVDWNRISAEFRDKINSECKPLEI